MRRSITASLCAAILAATAAAQQEQVTKGSKHDLRGATSVVVDTGHDRELRDVVLAHLGREIPELRVVEAPTAGTLVIRVSRTIAERSRLDDSRESAFNAASSRPQARPPTAPRVSAVATREIAAPRLPSHVHSAPSREPEVTFDHAPAPAPSRYVLGSVLRPAGDGKAIEAMHFKQPVMRSFDLTARDFVRKLAKAYRSVSR